jgi:hypothetical protein
MFYQSKEVALAEDAVRMEDIGNAYFNYNYMNYFKKLCVGKSGRMQQFGGKGVVMNVMLVESAEV